MTPRTFIILAAVTLASVVGALSVVIIQPGIGPVAYVDEPAFPELRAEPDAVAKVTIQTKDGTITLTRTSPETWTAPEAFDYPAAADKIRKLVRQLNDMRLIETKTANVERYDRLEVEDVSADASSRLISLLDDDGKILAEALIGKRLYRLTGNARTGTYIRRPGEAQSWLASGGFDIEPDVDSWLDQLIVEISQEEVAQIALELTEGGNYSISRAQAEDELQVDNLSEGEVVDADANLLELAGAMSLVQFESVKPGAELALPEASNEAEVTTFDGMKLSMTFGLIDDMPWATFGATEVQTSSGEAASDLVKQRIESFNNKTVGWIYQINQSVYQRLTKPRDSWVDGSDSTS